MEGPCKITGTLKCRCGFDRPSLTVVENDLKTTLTKLFTDHAVYTVFVIRSMIDGDEDAAVQTERLLENQVEIGENLAPYVGEVNGKAITQLLTEHIKLAAGVVTAAKSGNANAVEEAKAKLFENSDQVAAAFTLATDGRLPLEVSQQMWRLHNELVVQMAVHRLSKEWKLEQEIYDVYYNEILAMIKAIYASLPAI